MIKLNSELESVKNASTSEIMVTVKVLKMKENVDDLVRTDSRYIAQQIASMINNLRNMLKMQRKIARWFRYLVCEEPKTGTPYSVQKAVETLPKVQ